MARACVVVPTKNEGPKVTEVIASVKAAMASTAYDETVIIVVDDSTDDTKSIARKTGAVVLRGDGDGLGAAMYRGLKEALTYKPQVILAVDGDGQADAAEIPRFLEPIEKGEADLVLGSRFAEAGLVDYKYRWRNRLGTWILVRILRSYTGLPLTDSHGGLRAMVPEVVERLEMLGTHTYVQETIIDAVEKGYRVKEIPSTWSRREHGGSRVVGSIPKYIAYTWPVLFIRSGNHIRWLYTLGLALVLLGFLTFFIVLWQEGFNIAVMGHRTPAFILIALMMITGVQLFFFGFILQLLKQTNKRLGLMGKEPSQPPRND